MSTQGFMYIHIDAIKEHGRTDIKMSQQPTASSEYVSPLARLFQIARSQGYLTYDEILAVMPHPDLTLDQLDRLFGALLAAGIPYGDAGTVCAHPADNKQGS
jgi:hypothetical protein